MCLALRVVVASVAFAGLLLTVAPGWSQWHLVLGAAGAAPEAPPPPPPPLPLDAPSHHHHHHHHGRRLLSARDEPPQTFEPMTMPMMPSDRADDSDASAFGRPLDGGGPRFDSTPTFDPAATFAPSATFDPATGQALDRGPRFDSTPTSDPTFDPAAAFDRGPRFDPAATFDPAAAPRLDVRGDSFREGNPYEPSAAWVPPPSPPPPSRLPDLLPPSRRLPIARAGLLTLTQRLPFFGAAWFVAQALVALSFWWHLLLASCQLLGLLCAREREEQEEDDDSERAPLCK